MTLPTPKRRGILAATQQCWGLALTRGPQALSLSRCRRGFSHPRLLHIFGSAQISNVVGSTGGTSVVEPNSNRHRCVDAALSHLLQLSSRPTGGSARLAHYVLNCIPGFRAKMRMRTHSTDYDVYCAIEGPTYDFRSELGRYFICECKDWNRPANVTAILKFSFVGAASCEMPVWDYVLKRRNHRTDRPGGRETATA